MNNMDGAVTSIASESDNNTTAELFSVLDQIMDKLNIDDYKSIFFLLMDFIGLRDFLYIVKKNEIQYLKCEFRERYFKIPRKTTILIEILGTMKKFSLLKILSYCNHSFKAELDSFTQISGIWKMLFNICEQLSDSQVAYLKEKLLPNTTTEITCAEELFGEALLAHVFEESNLSTLKDIFHEFHPECFQIISSYEGSSKLSYYPIKRPRKKSPCGYAIILNHEKFCGSNDNPFILEERPHSRKDADSLKNLWDNFGFLTSIHHDLKSDEVFKLFRDFAKLNHSLYDAFIVCILSHGIQGRFFTHDCKDVSVQQLVDIMANRCPTLLHAPKLFFVEACQGTEVQEGVYNYKPIDIHPQHIGLAYKTICMDTPAFSDVLIAHSTIEGYASFSPQGKNSWFISSLVHVMEKYGEELTITNVLTKVTDIVAKKTGHLTDENDGPKKNCKQTPGINLNTLRHELKFKKVLV